jgi:enoyl-CoA hydratase/carnithine racemase
MSDVTVERVGRTSVVTINRPEARNALTRTVIGELKTAFEAANADVDVRCVVLGGAGGHFCAGADLRRAWMEDPQLMDHIEDYMDEFHAVVRALVRCTKPTIAMLDGAAVGFGADLAYACDLRVASENAYVQEKFVNIGLMPDGGGTFWLPRLVGTARAMRQILLAEKVDAKELDALGLLTRPPVAPGSLREVTMEIARKIEAGPPLAYREIKAALYASWGSIEDALRREREGQLKLLRSNDCIEGIAAWAQKRPPEFKGS